MSRFASTAAFIATGLLVSGSASAAVTAYAHWNDSGSALIATPDWGVAHNPDQDMDFSTTTNVYGNSLVHTSAFERPIMAPGMGKFGAGSMDSRDTGTVGKSNSQIFHLNAGYAYGSETAYTLVNASAGTIEFWFKPDWDGTLNDNTSHTLFYARSNGNGVAANAGYSNNRNRLILDSISSGGGVYDSKLSWVTGTGTAKDIPFNRLTNLVNDWNHIAIAWDANQLALYMNGILVGSDNTLAGAGVTTMDHSTIESYAGGGRFDATTAPNATTPADGFYDEWILSGDRRYAGSSYLVPTSEIPEPTGLAILAGIMFFSGFSRKRMSMS